MQVTQLSLSDAFAVAQLQSRVIVIFYANWQPKALEKLVSRIHQFPAHKVQELIAVQSSGSDDVESYVIEVLHATALPCIAVFERSEPTHVGTSWESIIQYLYSGEHDPSWRHFRSDVNYISLLLNQSLGSTNLASIAVDEIQDCIQIFISGDRSSVGKSTMSLLLLASLVSLGVSPTSLAYIKPVTQCEAVQPVTHYCQAISIATVEVSPIIFYQGFTRAFLAGETETAPQMLSRIRNIVRSLSVGKKLVVIDGVGYPSVGSICSLSNADVAHYLQSPVLLIGKPGVGDAVDSYNLLAAFFENHSVRVLGGIFNKLEPAGFYSLENCRVALTSYFAQQRPSQMPYGFMPKAANLKGLEGLVVHDAHGNEIIDLELLSSWASLFLQHIDIQRIVFDAWMAKVWFPLDRNALMRCIIQDS